MEGKPLESVMRIPLQQDRTVPLLFEISEAAFLPQTYKISDFLVQTQSLLKMSHTDTALFCPIPGIR